MDKNELLMNLDLLHTIKLGVISEVCGRCGMLWLSD